MNFIFRFIAGHQHLIINLLGHVWFKEKREEKKSEIERKGEERSGEK